MRLIPPQAPSQAIPVFRPNNMRFPVNGYLAAYFACRLVPSFPFFRQAFQNDSVQVACNIAAERTGFEWFSVQDAVEHLPQRAGDLVRKVTRQRIEKDQAEGVDIGADVDLVARTFALFGRRPRQRPNELARLRDRPTGRAPRVVRCRDLRQPEIENVRFALFVHENVARLQIAMNHTANMGGVYGIADFGEQPDRLLNGQVFVSDVLVERPPGNEVHHEEGILIGLLWRYVGYRRAA